MADVRRSSGRSPGASGSDDRGQLLLVGALALAVVFVALALLLNTAIFTGNLATRDPGVGAGPAVEYVSGSQRAGVDAIASVNRQNNTSATDLNRALEATVDRWDDLASHHRAVAGDAADVDVVGTTNGTRIQQDDASRAFTNASGTTDWTVAAGVTGVRSMQFVVDNSTLTGIDDATNATTEPVFEITVSSPSSARTAYVYHNTSSGTAEVLVDDGDREVCPVGSVTDGTFAVNVSNASVGGASCPALGTLDDTDSWPSVSIEYRDGGAAGGTYTMVVDEPPSSLSLDGLNDNGPSPYWTDAVYRATFDVTYRTSDLDYAATIEVEPE